MTITYPDMAEARAKAAAGLQKEMAAKLKAEDLLKQILAQQLLTLSAPAGPAAGLFRMAGTVRIKIIRRGRRHFNVLKAFLPAVDRRRRTFVAAIFGADGPVGFLQVFSRFVLNRTPSWSEEIQIFGHIWLVFLAIPIAYRRGAHFTVEASAACILARHAQGVRPHDRALVDRLCGRDRLVQLSRLAGQAGRRLARSRDPMSYPVLRDDHGQRVLLFVVLRRIGGEPPAPLAEDVPPEPAPL